MSTTATATASTFDEVVVTTRRSVTAPVRIYEPAGDDAVNGSTAATATVLALHGAGGWLPTEPVLNGLAAAGLRVVAPVWPAWSEHTDEDRLSDMADFALHGWDVASEMGLLSGGASRWPAPDGPLDGRHDRGGDGSAGTAVGRANGLAVPRGDVAG